EDRPLLEAARTDHRNLERPLDGGRVLQVDALDGPRPPAALPPPAEEGPEEAAGENPVVAVRQGAAGKDGGVGALHVVHREAAGRVAGVGEDAAAGDVDRVDPGLLEPLAQFDL